MSIQSLSFKDHLLCILAEHEKLEQQLRQVQSENGRLRSSAGITAAWFGLHLANSSGSSADGADFSPTSLAGQYPFHTSEQFRPSLDDVSMVGVGEVGEEPKGKLPPTLAPIQLPPLKLTGNWDQEPLSPSPEPLSPSPTRSATTEGARRVTPPQLEIPESSSQRLGPQVRGVPPAASADDREEAEIVRCGMSNRSILNHEELQRLELDRSSMSTRSASGADALQASYTVCQATEMLGEVSRKKTPSREHSLRTVDFAEDPPEICAEWQQSDPDQQPPFTALSPSERWRIQSIPRGASRLCGEAMVDPNSFLQRLVMRPNSFWRGIWDFFSILVLSFDIISIPLEVFNFNNDNDDKGPQELSDYLLQGMEWSTTCFWTLDILASFLTGFHYEGLIEMRPSVIAKRYLNNGFCLDMTVVLVDWILAIFTFQIKAVVRVGKTARVLRLVRMVRAMRLIRSVKIARLLTSLFTYIKSDLLRTLCSILLMLVVLVVANHYIACGWYLMGTLSPAGWLESNGLQDATNYNYIYMTALHWSLTQFTPASMEVYPCNLHERIYTVCVLLFALVTFSSFVSGITNGMMYLRKLKTEPAQQEAILRQYFQESRISAELGQRIWKFLHVNHFQNRKRVHRSDLAILNLVPESLRNKLSEELYLPVVTWNPFFHRFGHAYSTELNEVCHKAVTEKCLTTREELFLENKVAEKMSFITMGTMDYRHRVIALCDAVSSGSWACEPVLWMTWKHCGRLAARTSCEIIQVNAKTFRTQITKERLAHVYASSYASVFRNFIRGDKNAWYSDIWTNTAELEELLNNWEDENPGLCEEMSSMRNTTCSSEDKAMVPLSVGPPQILHKVAARLGLAGPLAQSQPSPPRRSASGSYC